MSAIDPTATLGSLVAERPALASVFELLRLDYCCEGSQSLARACARRGLDAGTVRSVLEAHCEDEEGRDGDAERDWREATIAELIRHIVAVHHGGLRATLPRIDILFSTVVRVHGLTHPKLRGLWRAFERTRALLELHMTSEEEVLFPALIALERSGVPIDEELVAGHESEHRDIGERLSALRDLGGQYEASAAICETHRALLGALAAFELDTHRHVHEENNVLLVRARELRRDAARKGVGAMPAARAA